MERYRVTIDGRERLVELPSPDKGGVGGTIAVTVDGEQRTVDIRRLGMGAFSIIDRGAARLVQVSGASAKLTIELGHPDGEPRTVIAEVIEAREADARGGTASGAGVARVAEATVRSPIPGKVVKILVRPGDAAKAGQPMLVIEAMKMENELRAPRDAVVEKVAVREGQAVEAGETLIELR